MIVLVGAPDLFILGSRDLHLGCPKLCPLVWTWALCPTCLQVLPCMAAEFLAAVPRSDWQRNVLQSLPEHKGDPLRLAACTSLLTVLIICPSSGLWLTVEIRRQSGLTVQWGDQPQWGITVLFSWNCKFSRAGAGANGEANQSGNFTLWAMRSHWHFKKASDMSYLHLRLACLPGFCCEEHGLEGIGKLVRRPDHLCTCLNREVAEGMRGQMSKRINVLSWQDSQLGFRTQCCWSNLHKLAFFQSLCKPLTLPNVGGYQWCDFKYCFPSQKYSFFVETRGGDSLSLWTPLHQKL